MSAPGPMFSRKVPAASLPRGGQGFHIAAKGDALAAVAADLDAPRVDRLEADLMLRPASGGRLLVEGSATATVWRTCVVTLDDFPEDVATAISATFVEPERLPKPTGREIERSLDDEDPPEPLVDGAVDIHALVVEFVALALEPYPRKPGAVLPEDAAGDAGPESPFAALAALKAGRQ